MFADTIEASWAERSRRGWSTLTSFAFQGVVAGLLLLIPLMRPEAVPAIRRLMTPISAGRLRAEPPAAQPRHTPASSVLSNISNGHLMQPPRIPQTGTQITDDAPPPEAPGAAGLYIPGLGGIGGPGVIGGTREAAQPVMPALPPPSKPVRISHMSEGDLIRRVQPIYPPTAIAARIQGEVWLQAVISKEGTIENLHVVKGHPMLVRAAIDAVSQWRYRPYVLNNEPVEVETQITVKFSLGGN